MSKCVVALADGTWKSADSKYPTNVAKLHLALVNDDEKLLRAFPSRSVIRVVANTWMREPWSNGASGVYSIVLSPAEVEIVPLARNPFSATNTPIGAELGSIGWFV